MKIFNNYFQPISSGPELPPGFENFTRPNDHMGLILVGSMEALSKLASSPVLMQVGLEDERSSACDGVPETPTTRIAPTTALQDSSRGRILDEDALVEAQVTWELGKQVGLTGRNNEEIITVLSILDKNQGIGTAKKKGRPRKKKEAIEK